MGGVCLPVGSIGTATTSLEAAMGTLAVSRRNSLTKPEHPPTLQACLGTLAW